MRLFGYLKEAILLKDKVTLITGGGRGIGRELALKFAAEGSDIGIFEINEESTKTVVSQIHAMGRRSIGLGVDVRRLTEAEEGINKILDKFGRIDILINNAGITKDNLVLRMEEKDWDTVVEVNLKGTFNCIKAVARHMLKARSGRIINIASVIGLIGNAGQTNYAASKAGIIGLTKSIAKEFASRGITCNAIAPGFIQTEMTKSLPEDVKNKMLSLIPMGSFGAPIDVAEAALFLAGRGAGYITGQVIVVDGGMVM